MGHHFMAVCVVCLLCAEHLPCKQHFDNASPQMVNDPLQMLNVNNYDNDGKQPPSSSSSSSAINSDKRFPADNLPNPELYDYPDERLPNIRRGRTRTQSNLPTHTNSDPELEYIEKNILRNKRHATSGHSNNNNNNNGDETIGEPINSTFLKRLFKEFGSDDELRMNVIGFERMLKLLGLNHLFKDPQPESDPHSLNTCISIVDLITRISGKQLSNSNSNNNNNMMTTKSLNSSTSTINNITAISTPMMMTTASALVNGTGSSQPAQPQPQLDNVSSITSTNINQTPSSQTISSIKENLYLNSHDLMMLCPILLYKLSAPTSSERLGCIQSNLLAASNFDYGQKSEIVELATDRKLVWLYGMLSILGISLCGLLGVLVVPFMEKDYYQSILQFFVGLAVGTLAGDALLHLMPHAMLTNSNDSNVHSNMTAKGLVATMAILFFFITERALTMIAELRNRCEKKKDQPMARFRIMRDPEHPITTHQPAGEKHCKHKYSSYPYCYDEIALAAKEDHQLASSGNGGGNNSVAAKENGLKNRSIAAPIMAAAAGGHNHKTYKSDTNGAGSGSDYIDTAQNLLDQSLYHYTNTELIEKCDPDGNLGMHDTNTVSTNLDDGSIESIIDNKPASNNGKEENYTVILREHETNHHGHSHVHGHVHSPPKTLSAVAWMVIMGDGLHNFTDGMAIGAAFSNNIAGGFSTAIAVFCHELPHELGDFAVLLKAGMSARQAVYYNLLSSILSFFGTILGMYVGDTPEASAWIFACAAGMFIYIALVDMMPELASSHKDKFAVSQLLLQFSGMAIGIGIMLIIALYEDDLKDMFSATQSHDHGHGHHHHH